MCEIVWVESNNVLLLDAFVSMAERYLYFDEFEGQVLIELVLSTPVPFDFTVYIDSFWATISSELHVYYSVQYI